MPLHASTDNKSEIYKHINSCKQFQHVTKLLQISTDEPNTEQFDLTSFLLNNSHIIDRAQHWSNLLFKEALTIRRQKPELNHGTRASRELSGLFSHIRIRLYLQTFCCGYKSLRVYTYPDLLRFRLSTCIRIRSEFDTKMLELLIEHALMKKLK